MLDARDLENIPEHWLREAEAYSGLVFQWTRWERPTEEWTHDDCRFCWAGSCDHRERCPNEKNSHRERGCYRHAYRAAVRDGSDVWICRSCFKRLPSVGMLARHKTLE